MNIYSSFAKSKKDEIAHEIENLRQKYAEAIKHRLKMRETMKKIIKNWQSLSLSKFFK